MSQARSRRVSKPARANAACASCHGTHDMVPVKQGDSPVFKLNLAKTCSTCHDNAKLTKEYRMGKTEAAGHYLDNPASGHVLRKLGFVSTGKQDLYGLARKAMSPAERYVWPEGATPASLTHNHGAHPSH